MKLLVKSDDYGFTKGVTAGAYDAMTRGILNNTGLFANMPAAEEAAKLLIRDCPHVCFGIDINVVSGPCVSDPKDIPALADPVTGEFIRSVVKYQDPRFEKGGEKFQDTSKEFTPPPNEALWPYAEVYKEACAQIDRYIEIVGKKPEYVTGHSISRAAGNYVKAIRDAAGHYGIPFAPDVLKACGVVSLPNPNVKPFTMEAQVQADVESSLLTQLEAHKDADIVISGGHAGFVDAELIKYSTYTIIRTKDHQAWTSPKVMDYIKANNVELITFRDLFAMGK